MGLYTIKPGVYTCVECGLKYPFPSQVLDHYREKHWELYRKHLKKHPGEGHR